MDTWQRENKGKHLMKEQAINDYLEWYVQYLLDNGFHPSRTERMNHARRDSKTLLAWDKEIVGRGWADIVKRGPLGSILVIKNVYFIDDRKKDGK